MAAIAFVGSITAALLAPAAHDVDLDHPYLPPGSADRRRNAAWDRHSAAGDAVFKANPPTPIRREVKAAYAGLDALLPEQHFAKLIADLTNYSSCCRRGWSG